MMKQKDLKTSHTLGGGGRGDLRIGKGIRGETFESVRGE